MADLRCLHPQWLISIEPSCTALENQAVVIENGRIKEIIAQENARQAYPDAEHVLLDQHVLLPGFINAHGHSAMALLRGLADDLALMDWLNHHIWPAEKRHVSEEFVFEGTLLAMAEMLRGGTTTVNDMYFHHEAVARAGLQAKMRTVVGCSILEFPTPYAMNADDYIGKAVAACTMFQGEPLIRFMLAPHAPYTVSDHTFQRVIALAEELDCRIHCHIHETADEVANSVKDLGKRPLARLHELGFLTSRLVAAHCVHLTEQEIELLARQGVSVAHNPTSNLKLASGIAPVAALRAAGVNVGIGTDSAASNNKLDMLAEMRLAALLPKVHTGNPQAIPANEALTMATLGGARALGLENEIGSVLPGKAADLIAVNLSAVETQPCFDPVSHLVYAAGREQVSHVWVNGVPVMQDRALTTLDISALQDKARWWKKQIVQQSVS